MSLDGVRGKFITFEGVEGAGKSTQSKRLVDYFNDNNIKSIWTREPGGCKEAEEIREVVVSGAKNKWDSLTELLLMNTSRRVHTTKKIQPLLKDGFTIVSDRYFDSSVAYQGYGHRMNLDDVYKIQDMVVGDFKPDLTIILDLDVVEGLLRTGLRGDRNRFEDMTLEFHERVRKGFKEIVKMEPNRCKLVDVTDKSEEEVFNEIITLVEKNF